MRDLIEHGMNLTIDENHRNDNLIILMDKGKVEKRDNIKELREICQPESTKSHYAMRAMRSLSIYFTKFFISLNISPNTITFSRALIGIIGIILIALTHNIIGLLVFHIAILLDLCDGEMMRYYFYKKKRKESIIIGSFLDKNIDSIYRPMLIIAGSIGLFALNNNSLYLYLGMIGSFLISLDQIFKLRIYDVLHYKEKEDYLKRREVNERDKKRKDRNYDFIYELFRINNPFTLFFWFTIFGYFNIFLLIYVPLLFIQVIKTGILQYSLTKEIDKMIIGDIERNDN